jgi:5'-3' exonuclease
MKRLIVDLSSIIWTCLLAGKDVEFGKQVEFEGKEFQVNSAAYGYENSVNHLVSVMKLTETTPINMIIVVEGMNSKLLRSTIFPDYKGGVAPSRPKDAYEEFSKLREMLVNTFTALGATAVKQDGIESDDVIAYLALNLDGPVVIDSNDGDLAALIDDENPEPRITMYKFSRGAILKENPFGPFPCKYIRVFKALVGDSSDKLPGAKGFGDKAWLNMMVNFGLDGLELMEGLLITKKLEKLEEDYAALPALKIVVANKDTVLKCFACATLYPEKINTLRKPLEWTVGMVKPAAQCEDARLKHWAGQKRLVSAENYAEAVKFLKLKLPESPFISFDVETSSNDTADEWVANAKAKAKDDSDIGNVDVFGADLTSFSVTFGLNMQYTLFFTIDHVEEKGVTNITKKQAKDVIRMFPEDKINAIQNVAFEFPVVMENLGSLDVEEVPA